MVNYYTLLAGLILSTAANAQHSADAPLRTTMPVNTVHAGHRSVAERGASLWSDDFSDPGHWTFGTLNGTTSNWVIGTTAPSGDYAIPAINSTSAANGFALFDSDLNCTADDGYLVIADPIDLGAVSHVMLQFEQFYRRFLGYTYVDVSNDGMNWTTFEVNSALTTGEYTANPDLLSLDISSVAALQSTVWFRFRYTGNCDYAWMVDDVALLEQPAHEMKLVSAATTSWDFSTNATFDSVYYSIIPLTEIRPRALNMTFFNAGYMPASNVVAHITTSDGYDESQQWPTVAPGDSMTWFAPLWTPTAEEGVHTIYYSVEADDPDANPDDNADTAMVSVSHYVYARDKGARDAEIGDGVSAFSVGNWFHTSVFHQVMNAIDVAFSSSSEVGVEVNAQLLNDARQVLAETNYITLAQSDLSEFGQGNFVRFWFDSPLQLDAGSDYFVRLQHFGGADVRVAASGTSVPQSSLLYRGSNDTWYSISPTPMVRMIVDIIGEVGDNAPLSDMHLGQCVPNPATGKARLGFTLNASMQAKLALYNLSGKLLRTLVDGPMGPGQHQVEVNTSDLDAGVYFYTLTTPAGIATKRMTVMH